jgi:nucleotide-binding universal stress UspA family protein
MTQPRTKRIVVAYDFSELAERALHQALELAPHKESEVHVLAVGAIQGELLKLPEHDPTSQAEASEIVRRAVAKDVAAYATEHGPPILERIAVYASEGHPAEQIVALADEIDADLVVMGTHSRSGLQRVMLGSVAEAVTRRAPCGVFVIRPRDFLEGEKLPEIQAAPKPGEPTLRHFRPRAVYHYTGRLQQEPDRVLPVG